MKTISIKEFIEDNAKNYTSKASDELYELLVKNGIRRNNIYPYEKFVKEKIIHMHPSNSTVHGSVNSGKRKEVLIEELEEPIEPAKYDSNKGWTF